MSALTPEFQDITLTYVANGADPQVSAQIAGGVIGDGQAVDMNYRVNPVSYTHLLDECAIAKNL